MIIAILTFVLLVICIVLIYLDNEYWDTEWVMAIGVILGFLSLITLIAIITQILIVQIPRSVNYEITQYERTQLIEQYEQGNQYAYDSIIEFDKQLLSIKKWANNPFTNWFYNQRIANEVDFILYEDVDFEIGGN